MSNVNKRHKNLKNKKNERRPAVAVLSTSGLAYELLPTTDQSILDLDQLLDE